MILAEANTSVEAKKSFVRTLLRMIRNEFSEFQEEVETRFFTNKTKIIFDPRPQEKRIVRPLQDHYKSKTTTILQKCLQDNSKKFTRPQRGLQDIFARPQFLQDHKIFCKTITAFVRAKTRVLGGLFQQKF